VGGRLAFSSLLKAADDVLPCLSLYFFCLLLSAIALWNITKKKPVFMEHLAHGVNEHVSESEGVIGTARWITSLACLPYGDTFVSGSWDGSIRVWSIAPTLKSFSLLFTIPAKGFVNSLEIIAPPASQVDFTHWRASRTPADDEDVKQVKAATAREATTLLVVGAVSQEPRLGRWMTLKEGVRNGVVLAHLVNKRPGEEEEEVSATVTEEDDTM
jgi:ribosomal RNA-processing protein 9